MISFAAFTIPALISGFQFLVYSSQEELRVQHELAIETAKAKIEQNATVEKAKIDAEARIRQERENEDVQLRKLKAQWEADKEKVREAALAGLTMIGKGIIEFLNTPSSVLSLVVTVAGMALAVYMMREGMRVVSREFTRRLSQPPLIRESSMSASILKNLFRQLFGGCLGMLSGCLTCGRGSANKRLKKTFDGVVLEADLAKQLEFYASSIRNTRANHAPMRHMLFYGPPGTGKTMLVRSMMLAYSLHKYCVLIFPNDIHVI